MCISQERCPGCPKGVLDTSSCFDSCPLSNEDMKVIGPCPVSGCDGKLVVDYDGENVSCNSCGWEKEEI